jgi:hypothetical protein
VPLARTEQLWTVLSGPFARDRPCRFAPLQAITSGVTDMKRLKFAGSLIASTALLALCLVVWRQAQIKSELDAILARLRAAKTEKVLVAAKHDFERWMRQHVVRGQTTRSQIVAYFGNEYHDLDRPTRYGVETGEYLLYGDRVYSGVLVVFDFDFDTAILQDWQISYSECGYCPHILASDGQWRLEGKMLAGRIGASREGPDTLLLPRLAPMDGLLRVRLANWAPEIECIKQVRLGIVACDAASEVDMDGDGNPYVWKETRAVELESAQKAIGSNRCMLRFGHPAAGQVVVLEARNTGEFEQAMRQVVFESAAAWPRASLELEFDEGGIQELLPVGTKFFRRMVIPVPPNARALEIRAPRDMWLIRRAWLGQGQVARDVAWLSPVDASGHEADAPGRKREDGAPRFVLAPTEEVELDFLLPRAVSDKRDYRFVLNLSGYYELIPPSAGNMLRKRSQDSAFPDIIDLVTRGAGRGQAGGGTSSH